MCWYVYTYRSFYLNFTSVSWGQSCFIFKRSRKFGSVKDRERDTKIVFILDCKSLYIKRVFWLVIRWNILCGLIDRRNEGTSGNGKEILRIQKFSMPQYIPRIERIIYYPNKWDTCQKYICPLIFLVICQSITRKTKQFGYSTFYWNLFQRPS